jgi:hypothetical protein
MACSCFPNCLGRPFRGALAAPPSRFAGTNGSLRPGFTGRLLPIGRAKSAVPPGPPHPEHRRLEAPCRSPNQSRPQSAWLRHIVFIAVKLARSAVILVVRSNIRAVAVLLYELSDAGSFAELSRLGVILQSIMFVLAALGIKLWNAIACCGAHRADVHEIVAA